MVDGRVALAYALEPSAAASNLIHRSILHALVQRALQLETSATQLSILSAADAPFTLCAHSLTRFGFTLCRNASRYDYVVPHSPRVDLQPLKTALRLLMTPERKIGRGYAIDVRGFDPRELAALTDEYHRLAWGFTHWARHAEVAPDEAEVMQQFVFGARAVEIGAGSGRLTGLMRARVQHLTATDYCADIVQSLRETLPPETDIELVVDDITHSMLPSATYDLVAFWENGLGAFLTLEARQRAVQAMVRLLAPGGRLILALRALPQSPIDHVMPVAQDAHSMGIYHTFSMDEVDALMPASMRGVAYIVGADRPAGGHAFFLVYEKAP